MDKTVRGEGLKPARLMMVLSSISPLFVLWAIRGNTLIPNTYFLAFCGVMIVIPNCFLLLKLRTAKKNKETAEIIVGRAEDHRDHLLVYLFSMLLPFYTADLGHWRDLSATLVAICLIVFLFWNLNLHYMNLLFAVKGYRVFTIYPPQDGNPHTGKDPRVLIMRRATLYAGQQLFPYRLSDTVFWEAEQ